MVLGSAFYLSTCTHHYSLCIYLARDTGPVLAQCGPWRVSPLGPFSTGTDFRRQNLTSRRHILTSNVGPRAESVYQFEIIINVIFFTLSAPFIYVLGLRPVKIFYCFSARMDFRRQNLRSKVDPRTESGNPRCFKTVVPFLYYIVL